MIKAVMQPIVLQWIVMAMFGQVEIVRAPGTGPSKSTTTPNEPRAAPTALVMAETLDVYDRPDETSYITSVVNRGERINVRNTLDGGWLAIDPPAKTICWIEGSAMEKAQDSVGRNGHVTEPSGSTNERPIRATIATPQAVMRSGNLEARLPGPLLAHLSQGTLVRLLDREPLETGRGRSTTVWHAILPPSSVVCYVRCDGTRRLEAARPEQAATRTVYTTARYATTADEYPALEGVAAAVATEIKTADAVHQSIRTHQPPTQWRFETVRATYQSILKRAGTDPHVEEAIRERLARVTRYEQAAQAARKLEEILAQSHRRDQEVDVQKRRVAAAGRSSARTFNAVGYMQASTEEIDGRKLYVLIGKDGSTLAYLDIPPGLDIDRLVAHRVGVRGDPHYNEDLGSRLITVRDLERMESRR